MSIDSRKSILRRVISLKDKDTKEMITVRYKIKLKYLSDL